MSAANLSNGQLRAIVERIERLEEEKAALVTDIKEVYGEAKSNGFDTKTLRAVIRLRKQDPAERQEQEALLDLYKEALGMLVDTPLGEAAVEAATNEARIKRAARDSGVKRALKAFGTPVPLTEEEKAKGFVATFKSKDGGRVSIGVPPRRGGGEKSFTEKVGAAIQDGLAAVGTPVEPTDEERRQGVTMVVVKPDGERVTMTGGKPFSPAAQAAKDLAG